MVLLKKVDAKIAVLLKTLCLICFTGLFVILLMNVFFRWVPILSRIPSFSMGWFDEIVEMLFAWLVFSGSSLLCRDKEHFKVDLIQMKLEGKRSLYIMEFAINLVTLVFFTALLYYGWKLAEGAVQTTPVLRMQKRWMYMCVPFNSLLMTIYTIRDAVCNLQRYVSFGKTA